MLLSQLPEGTEFVAQCGLKGVVVKCLGLAEVKVRYEDRDGVIRTAGWSCGTVVRPLSTEKKNEVESSDAGHKS
jgi:hypothetical protein